MNEEHGSVRLPSIDVSDDVTRIPDALGYVTITPQQDGSWSCGAIVRPGLTEDQHERFVAWLRESMEQVAANNDPGANGWAPSSLNPGGWYMAAVEHIFPSLD